MTNSNFPPKVVERVARAMCLDAYADPDYTQDGEPMWRAFIDATLAALRALSPAAQAVIKGEAVAVPRSGTTAILKALHHRTVGGVFDETAGLTASYAYEGALAASPYAEKEPEK